MSGDTKARLLLWTHREYRPMKSGQQYSNRYGLFICGYCSKVFLGSESNVLYRKTRRGNWMSCGCQQYAFNFRHGLQIQNLKQKFKFKKDGGLIPDKTTFEEFVKAVGKPPGIFAKLCSIRRLENPTIDNLEWRMPL